MAIDGNNPVNPYLIQPMDIDAENMDIGSKKNINDCLLNNLMIHIFIFLDQESLSKCMSVCKKWLSLRPALSSLFFRKITCTIQNVIINFKTLPFRDNKIASTFHDESEDFFIGHEEGSISGWLGNFTDYTARVNFLHDSSDEESVSFLSLSDDQLLCGSSYCVKQFDVRYQSVTRQFDFDSPLQSLVYAPNFNSIFVSLKNGNFQKFHLNKCEQNFKKNTLVTTSAFHIHTLMRGKGSIIAACNLNDQSFSFICSLNANGEMQKTLLRSKRMISFATLIESKDSENSEYKQLFGIYKPNTLFMHNYEEDKVTSMNLFPFTAKEGVSLQVTPLWNGYLFVYEKGSSNPTFLVLKAANLSPLYQFHVQLESDEELIDVNESTRAEENILLTTTDRVFSCNITFTTPDVETSSPSNNKLEEHSAKRKKTKNNG